MSILVKTSHFQYAKTGRMLKTKPVCPVKVIASPNLHAVSSLDGVTVDATIFGLENSVRVCILYV